MNNKKLQFYLLIFILVLGISIYLKSFKPRTEISHDGTSSQNAVTPAAKTLPAPSASPAAAATLSRKPSDKQSAEKNSQSLRAHLNNIAGKQWVVHENSDFVRLGLLSPIDSVLNAQIQNIRDDDRALALAKELAPFFGSSPAEISTAPQVNDAGLSISRTYTQLIGDYKVFDSSLTLLSRKEDGTVFQINSSLRAVEPLSTKSTLSDDEAKNIASSAFTDKTIRSINVIEAPLVWAGSRPHELAREVHLELVDNAKSVTVLLALVGMESRKVIYSRRLSVN